MAKTGTKTRQGRTAKDLTGSKGGASQSKRNGGGGPAKGTGMTRADRAAEARGDNPNPGKSTSNPNGR
ncbi:MAG TPA: hypothetical protein VEA69_10120 [Tepidisphaeraceae bacterium]|nr:hypothetical protein [Tepidisphaeraceae bacterium]